MFCPLCRATFPIPQNALDGWKDPTDGCMDCERSCEVCSTDQDVRPATVHCVDCRQLLCERCSLPHKKMPGGSHSIRQLAERDAFGSDLLIHCDEHAEETAASYCLDCELNICTKCFANSHTQHNCRKPDAAVCRRAILQVENETRKFVDSVQRTKRQVKERGEAVKRVVDRHVNNLLEQIDEIESDAIQEATAISGTLNVALSRSHSEHSSGVQPTRDPSAEELIMTCIAASCYSAPDVAFIPSVIDELTGDNENTVGSVHKTTTPGK